MTAGGMSCTRRSNPSQGSRKTRPFGSDFLALGCTGNVACRPSDRHSPSRTVLVKRLDSRLFELGSRTRGGETHISRGRAAADFVNSKKTTDYFGTPIIELRDHHSFVVIE